SRSSSASNSPVEAPDGAAPRPTVPSASTTSASTVGFPRESRISRPETFSIVGTFHIGLLLPGRRGRPAQSAGARPGRAAPKSGGGQGAYSLLLPRAYPVRRL